MKYMYTELTEQITRAFYIVYNNLGNGFPEKVYANALAVALQKTGHRVERKHPVQVFYDGQIVGEYYADLIVNDLVVIEVKVEPRLLRQHESRLMNCLRAMPYEVGLLLNFGPAPEVRRKTHANDYKPNLPRPV